jgi:hypothetical protein
MSGTNDHNYPNIGYIFYFLGRNTEYIPKYCSHDPTLQFQERVTDAAVKCRMENLLGLFLGWPSLFIALVLAALGSWWVKPGMMWFALVFSAPMSLYLSAAPAFPLVGVIPLAALTTGALMCGKPKRWPSMLSVGIYCAFYTVIAYFIAHPSTL